MHNLTQPSLLLKPFAESGDKNTLPDVNTDSSNPQLADLTNGFPIVTSKTPDDGGIPPERKDFNGLGYLTTLYDFFYQCGGTFTFNQTICDSIGGYPLGARLWYTDNNGASVILRSTIGNNTDNFITTPSVIGTSWVIDTPTTPVSSYVGDIKASLQTANHGRWLICNGQAVSRSEYAELFSLLGTNFGSGDGSTTFNLPDYRGKFLRGLGGNSAGNIYTTQAEGLPNITGDFDNYLERFALSPSGAFYKITSGGGHTGFQEYTTSSTLKLGFEASRSNSIYGNSAHVTPINQAVNYFIRA